MAKNSFVLYTSYMEQIELLSREQRGDLLTAIMLHSMGEEVPELDDMTRMAFSFISSQLDKDREKYEEICEKRREAGKLGGRPKAKKAKGSFEKQKETNESKGKQKNPDNEYDNEYDNDIKKENQVKEKYFPNDGKLDRAFCDYVEMRKKIRKPMTDRAVALAIGKLEKLAGGDNDLAILILEQSVMNSWQGLFALKDDTKKTVYDEWREA